MSYASGYEHPRVLFASVMALETLLVVAVVVASVGTWWPLIAITCVRYTVTGISHWLTMRDRQHEMKSTSPTMTSPLDPEIHP